jgi:A/G-specific adenine glycosylase
MPSQVVILLLNWYQTNARRLPWRGLSDPYAIWVSEIMLQQTRVEAVIPYYERWMERFSTLESLAAASQHDVLAAWEGLGYYSRARNLQRAAQIVMEEHGGKVPEDVRLLRKLPGIGRYSAAAIASIAFGLDEPALDGNIRRVMARLFNITEDARSPKGERILWDLVSTHLPPGRAGEYNQALMDLGASICTPRAPSCAICPLASECQSYGMGIQEQRPVTMPKPAIPHYQVTAAIITRDGQVLIARRPPHGLLGGLWEFPGGKQQENEDLPSCLRREIKEELDAEIEVGEPFGVYKHAFTHFRITLHAFCCKLSKEEPKPIQAAELAWVGCPALNDYPMGKVDRQIALKLQHSEKDLC